MTISTTSVASMNPISSLAPPTSPSNSPPILHGCHFCSSRNKCTVSLSPPDHRLQNITTQHPYPPCDGYNHSEVIGKFPLRFVDYQIPSWLTDISQCKTPSTSPLSLFTSTSPHEILIKSLLTSNSTSSSCNWRSYLALNLLRTQTPPQIS